MGNNLGDDKADSPAEATSGEQNWPDHVSSLTWNDIAELGIHQKTHELYWHGTKLVTEKRWGTVERRIAITGLAFAGLGVAATVVQAWAAIAALLG